MSHFTVMVVGENPEDQMEPFRVNNSNICDPQYLKYMVYNGETGESKIFETEEEAKKEYKGELNKEGSTIEGYWENPNAEWDWHVLGGRWTGFFELKDPKKGQLGRPGVFGNKAKKGTADTALKKHIDFTKMEDEAAKRARFRYENLERIFGGKIPKITTFPEFLKKDKYKIKEGENKGAIDGIKVRKEYFQQEGIKRQEELKKDQTLPKSDIEDLNIVNLDNYQIPIEEFMQQSRVQAGVPYAMIYQGS